MIAIDFDPAQSKQLQDLADAQGRPVNEFIRQIVAEYLEFRAATADPPESWAAASVTLAPEVMEPETWNDAPESDHGPR
jgi:hypothetical protein